MVERRQRREEFLENLRTANEHLSEEEFQARLGEYGYGSDRAAARPAPSTSIDMYLPSNAPELRGRENLATFIQRFETWASLTRCDYALNSEIAIRTSGTSYANLARLYNPALAHDSLQVWNALLKGLEKENGIMKMVIEIGSPSLAWRAPKNMVDESEEVAYDRAEREFETLEVGTDETVADYFARVNIAMTKIQRNNVVMPEREIKRIIMGSLMSCFPSEMSVYAMQGHFVLKDLETGLARAEKLQSDRKRRSTPSQALATAHMGGGQIGSGGGVRGRGRHGRHTSGRHSDGGGRHQQQGHQWQMYPDQQHQPPPSPAWQQHDQHLHQPRPPQPRHHQYPWSSWKTPHQGQHHPQTWQQHPSTAHPWSSWERPPQRRGRGQQQRRSHHHQSHPKRVMCPQCGKEEHFPADCVFTTTMPAPRPRHQSYSGRHRGAHVAQHDTYPTPLWTSHDGEGYSTSSYEPPPYDSDAHATPMPSPPGSVGPTSRTPPPSVPPSESDWNFSSWPSQALRAQYVPPGESQSSDLSGGDLVGSEGGSYLPSAFVGQPLGVDQVGDVCIGDSGPTTHMTWNADTMYDTKPPSPQRSRIILGDGSVKRVQFVGKIDLVFHSRTDHPVTLDDVPFVPGLGFNLFSFHAVQEKHDILLNKTGAHLLGGRLVFPHMKNGSSLRATRVIQGSHTSANNALAIFTNPPSPVQYSGVICPGAHKTSSTSNSCRRGNAGTGMGGKSSLDVAWKKGVESAPDSSGNDGMAATVFSPGGMFINRNKKGVLDIDHFHVSLAHAHSNVLKATAQQHGIQLVGELAPCSGCWMAKGIRAQTPHHTTSRAAAPLDLVHTDTAGPFPESLGGSRYVAMFVDSASRFQRPHGTRDKSASAILGVVQRLVADMRVPKSFRTDNGTEYTNSAFVEYCINLRIRRELTAPYTPQQNGPVESGLSPAIKAEHAARLEVNKLFPNVHFENLKGVRDPDGSSLWIESVLWASEGFNRSATMANSGMLSPYEVFFGRRPPMPVLPFCKPAYHRVPRQSKMDRQARPCFFLNSGYNQGSDCIKIMDAETGRIVHSPDVTWHQPREPLISPAPTVELGVPQSPYATGAPDYVQIRPTSAPSASAATPIAAPVPASVHAAPAPPQNLPAPIPDRVVRELGHEADVRTPGRRRSETRAMRESPRNMGLMSHAALAQGLATREAFDESFRDYEIPLPSAELPTAPFRFQMRTS